MIPKSILDTSKLLAYAKMGGVRLMKNTDKMDQLDDESLEILCDPETIWSSTAFELWCARTNSMVTPDITRLKGKVGYYKDSLATIQRAVEDESFIHSYLYEEGSYSRSGS